MRILITGGAGVVGRALCRELIKRGVCARVITLPGDSLASELPPEVEVRYGDITDYSSVCQAFESVDAVCHLAAVLLSTDESVFDKVNACGTENVIRACNEFHVKRLLYVSSISVTYPILTPYGKSKLRGESLVRESNLEWTIVRPTLVIGENGGIEFNIFAGYVCRFPVYFLPGGGGALKRPVRSVDLVSGIASAVLSRVSLGKTYALAGPKVMTMREMAYRILKLRNKRHLMLPLPWWISRKLAVLKNWIGGSRVSAEQALAGFLYDAAPDIENAKIDLNYNPQDAL